MNEAPATESEIVSLLQRRGERGGGHRRGVEISRRRFDALLHVDAKSGVVEAGAGMTLERLEQEVRSHDLTLGPVSPGMAALDVAGFLEGPYAGLRAVPGGFLESSCIALAAILPDGVRYVSRPSPRKAAGPDLDALFLGGAGRFGLIVSAALRLFARPRVEREATFSFPSIERGVSALRASIAAGARLRSATLRQRGGHFAVSAEVIGSPEGVERDLSTLGEDARAREGRPSGHEPPNAKPAGAEERELSWEDVVQAVESGSEVRCWRIALESVVAIGAGERGHSLSRGGGWANAAILAAALEAADPGGILGGPP